MTPTHTLEEDFNLICKSAGLIKLISTKPTWLTADRTEGVELDGKVIKMFNSEKGERAYKDALGSKLQVIIDAFKVPSASVLPGNIPDSSTLGLIKKPAPEVKHDEKEHQEKKERKDAKAEERKANAPEVIAPEKVEHKPNVFIPARVTTPQGNYIKGLVPAMKEIGKIKIGSKGEIKTSQKGTQYRPPIKFDHFELVSVLRDDKGNLIPDPVMKELGENVKELDIFLLYNDETLNFMTRYNEYRGGKCLCSGDGVKARILNGDEIECNPDTCKSFKEKKCKPNGILSVILTKSPRLGGVYKFRTTSYNSIKSILSSLFFIKSLTGGVLAMIPLKLTVSPMTVQPKDSATVQTIYVVNVEFAGTVQQLLEKTVEVSKYQSMMRGSIRQLEATARTALAIPESEEEGKDVQAEFYPEKQEAKV